MNDGAGQGRDEPGSEHAGEEMKGGFDTDTEEGP